MGNKVSQFVLCFFFIHLQKTLNSYVLEYVSETFSSVLLICLFSIHYHTSLIIVALKYFLNIVHNFSFKNVLIILTYYLTTWTLELCFHFYKNIGMLNGIALDL